MRSWQLKKSKGNDNKPLDLVNAASGLEYPFSLYFPKEEARHQRQLGLVPAVSPIPTDSV